MKILIEGTAKEIADFKEMLQNRQNVKVINGEIFIRKPYQQRYHAVNEVQEDQRFEAR